MNTTSVYRVFTVAESASPEKICNELHIIHEQISALAVQLVEGGESAAFGGESYFSTIVRLTGEADALVDRLAEQIKGGAGPEAASQREG